MTDQVPEQIPDTEPTWFGAAIDKHLSDALGRLFDSGRATVADGSQQRGNPARPPGPDVEQQTRDAQDLVEQTAKRVLNLTAAEQEQAAHKAEHDRIKALAEKLPEAERRIERWMGWRA